MLKKCLLALTVAGLFTSAANAAVTVTYTLQTTTDAGLAAGGAAGTWTVYAQITGGTAETAGLASVGVDVVPSNGAIIVEFDQGDGSLGSANVLPVGAPAGVSGGSGFNVFASAGDHGTGISAAQNTLQYKRNSGSTATNILSGVGIAAGTQNGATWLNPVPVATGYWAGQGDLSINISDPTQTTVLPLASAFPISSATVAGSTGISTSFADFVVPGPSATVGVPEPASLGVLALGGLALLRVAGRLANSGLTLN